ncbi:response regulator transcription factor [Aliivibrio sp. S4TY2]|uniref:response regulator transcription factor n=1 Tax=unclassified Aliivibrio TaxID=2645654 RepID=UPI00237902CA|nr:MULTISPECIES: response regulator transcription factor [unclassified Aliivibrio]MDD9155686.1 response regulator transcription factor [Aliivibrio sp. S4TY2]MDD9159634.1 response regulator transcription factor [Aliivibrio sp. S4TY1]MDD9163395.1 response regulator transcription factor [Aliivibrio sp. S4MY2]MDD9167395.1 response regulator transcription factor [Aliivibrio sp. S4MY4]MDD9186286.1 response regulator transcription factor [Aliivibrio sp. S4MY3]
MDDTNTLEILLLTKSKNFSALLLELLSRTKPNVKVHVHNNYSALSTHSNLSLLMIDYRTVPSPTSSLSYNPKSTSYPWLLLNTQESSNLSYQLIQQGYLGEISHKYALEHLSKAIESILNGEMWFSRTTLSNAIRHEIHPKGPLNSVIQNISHKHLLTKKERKVLHLLLDGMNNYEISEQCHISINTVKTHISNVYKKFNIHSRNELLQLIEKEFN